MWIVVFIVVGAIIAVAAAAGSASGKKRSNNTYVGTFVQPGKTTYFVTDDTTGKILAKASVRGSSEFIVKPSSDGLPNGQTSPCAIGRRRISV